jgi:hypothetical protein
LIWTDNAANYVLGTKSIASPSATGGGDAEKQEISVPDDFGDFLYEQNQVPYAIRNPSVPYTSNDLVHLCPRPGINLHAGIWAAADR